MRGRLEKLTLLVPVTSTGATRVDELPAPPAPPAPVVDDAPVRDSTGAWLSSGTLEQAASEATAIAVRRGRWRDFMVGFSFADRSVRAGVDGALNARTGPTQARADRPSGTAGEP